MLPQTKQLCSLFSVAFSLKCCTKNSGCIFIAVSYDDIADLPRLCFQHPRGSPTPLLHISMSTEAIALQPDSPQESMTAGTMTECYWWEKRENWFLRDCYNHPQHSTSPMLNICQSISNTFSVPTDSWSHLWRIFSLNVCTLANWTTCFLVNIFKNFWSLSVCLRWGFCLHSSSGSSSQNIVVLRKLFINYDRGGFFKKLFETLRSAAES